jgi:membrane-bound lytic murein transglycosylase D
MISWLVGVAVCLAFLAGCGGGEKGSLIKADQNQPELTAPVTDDGAGDTTLTEELSSKRLEELYAKSGIPGWDPGLEKELKNWDHQVNFDVPIQMNKQVKAYLVYFSTDRKAVIRRYLARSTRYLPMIKKVFQEAGLPEDLAYLAMIESGFNNKAYSQAAACGMWQFIRGTARRYGLVVNRYVDERRDPEKSTRAAAKYLLDLYKQFGSWYLAAASYNCGENRVQRELDQSNHKNFWQLSAHRCLPNETKNYVPQLIAATIIAKEPKKFGLKNIPYLPPRQVDTIQVDQPTSLTAAAVAVNVPKEEIADLNPELLRGVTPPDTPSFSLYLPPNSKELFSKNIVIARIEHPARASHPIRTARHYRRSYHRSHHHARSKHHRGVELAHKPSKRVYARAHHKSRRTYAKKGKSTRIYAKKQRAAHRELAEARASKHRTAAKSGRAPVVQASLLAMPSSARHKASKSPKADKKKVALNHSSRHHAKARTARNKKYHDTRLARKSDNSSKHRSRKSRSSRKDKYSRYHHRGKRPFMISEAR